MALISTTTISCDAKDDLDDNNSPADNNQPTMFFSLSGQPYGSDMNSLKPGVYIVRQGQTSKKIIIR